MNVTISMLLASTVAIALAPQSAAQEPNQSKVSSRRAVDVSLEGLEPLPRQMPGTGAGSIGLSARRSPGGLNTPLDCLQSIADQATGGCLQASSTPTLGVLYPYPGLNNVFVPQAFVGGGENNEATRPWCTVGGGKNNVAAGPGYSTVAGGDSNAALGPASMVGGGESNLAFTRWSTVGGGRGNTAGFYYLGDGFETVSGGQNNRAIGPGSTVGGGRSNTASGYVGYYLAGYATVGGGSGNTASGEWATVGGGTLNSAAGRSSTVGGGVGNVASGGSASVMGGVANTASGSWATVGGGRSNTAMGDYSFAAGRRAKANHNGAFVWGDSFDGDKASSSADQFNVYASGGVRMFTNSAATTGVLLAAGGGTWTMVSDRDAKENVEPVDARAVLDKVMQLPLATWNYKDQDDSIRHMGPMAQDFYAAFGLGLGDKTIDTIDPNGVALAAIKGLNAAMQDEHAELKARLAEKDTEIEANRKEIEALRAANEALLARVERLEAAVQSAMAK